MRLIDADKLMEHYSWWKGGSREMTVDEAKKNFDVIIGLQPSVEIVSCRECKYWKRGICHRDEHPRVTVEYDFCSKGERNDDGEVQNP